MRRYVKPGHSVFSRKLGRFHQRKYWYIFYADECVLCGRGGEWKERVYRRPRVKYVLKQNVCGFHFI